MRTRLINIFGLFLLLPFLLASGCSEVVGPLKDFTPNKAPSIISFTDDLVPATPIVPGLTSLLAVEASDPEGEALHFEYSSADGSFSDQTDTKSGSTVTFHAGSHIIPLQPVSVKVTVSDDRKGKASQEIVLGTTASGPALTSIGDIPVYTASSGQVNYTFTANTSGLYQVQAVAGTGAVAPAYDMGLANYYYHAGSEVTVSVDGPDWLGIEGDVRVSVSAQSRVWVLLKDSMDAVGTASFILTLDDGKPSSTVSVPDGTEALSAFQVAITASDALSGVSRISYTVNGGDPDFTGTGTVVTGASAVATIGAGGYGTYTLKYRAIDAVGNTEDVKSVTYTVVSGDHTPPVSTVNPANGQISKSSFTATISATDNLVGVSRISYVVNSAAIPDFSGNNGTIVTGSTANVPIGSSGDGTYELKYRAIDKEDNLEDVKTATYIVDGVKPSTTVNPANLHRSTTQFTVDISASDSVSGVSRIRYTLDGSDPLTSGTATVVYADTTQAVIGPAEGTYELKYQAIDNAENMEDVRTANYAIDQTAPGEVNLSVVSAGGESITVQWTPPGDSDLKDYLLTIDSESGGPTVEVVTVMTYIFSGLTNGTEYTIKVQTRDIVDNTSTGVSIKVTPPAESKTVYTVSGPADLIQVSETPARWNGYIVLSGDIDVTGQTWTPIGNSTVWFTGIFDGNGHAVTGLEMSDSTHSGLIGYANGATIRNTDVTGCSIQNADYYSGALVGIADSTTISDCHVTGILDATATATGVGGFAGSLMSSTVTGCTADVDVTDGDSSVGGFAGSVVSSTISDCIVTGSVVSYDGNCIAGVAGYVSGSSSFTGCLFSGTVVGANVTGGILGHGEGLVSRCRSTGTVTSSGDHAGGIVGETTNITITESWATGDVRGTYNFGGLVGWISVSSTCEISNCYARGNVTHTGSGDNFGGLLGYGIGSALTIINCYATGAVTQSGTTYGGFVGYIDGPTITNCFYYQPPKNPAVGDAGGYYTTQALMLQQSTYTGWDFTNTWNIDGTNDGFPYLRENPPLP
ncbi:MAG: hypothetical protein EPN93_18610 [Spirochaetes bacterium]|nr:MAG: hypothetical protein EPN93_18610 [Spirochaetota bacterium]